MSVCLSTRPVIILTFWLVALHLSGDREIVLGQMTSGEEKEQMTTQYFRTTLSKPGPNLTTSHPALSV